MILISKDVTDPIQVPFIVADHMITNPNGSVSFVLADGSVAGQEPDRHGVRHDAPNVEGIGVYQMFTLQPGGALVSVLTRPGDQPYTYTLSTLTAY
jgi:hypothetical protein